MLAASCGHPGGAAAAGRIVADSHRFGDSLHAGAAFLAASDRLLDSAKACQRRSGSAPGSGSPATAAGGPCFHLFEAAAQARAESVAILTCTAPARFEARGRWSAYLSRLARDASRAPTLPPLSTC